MSVSNKVILAISFAIFPLFAHGFLDFCFPVSLVILTYLFAWPGTIMYEVFSIQSMYLGVVFGVIINTLVIYYIGKYLDYRNNNVTKYRYKLIKIFSIICVALLGFMFIDPSCWS